MEIQVDVVTRILTITNRKQQIVSQVVGDVSIEHQQFLSFEYLPCFEYDSDTSKEIPMSELLE